MNFFRIKQIEKTSIVEKEREEEPFQALLNLTPRKGVRNSTELIREERERMDTRSSFIALDKI